MNNFSCSQDLLQHRMLEKADSRLGSSWAKGTPGLGSPCSRCKVGPCVAFLACKGECRIFLVVVILVLGRLLFLGKEGVCKGLEDKEVYMVEMVGMV